MTQPDSNQTQPRGGGVRGLDLDPVFGRPRVLVGPSNQQPSELDELDDDQADELGQED